MDGEVRGRHNQSDSALSRRQNRYSADAGELHTDAIWRIRLNLSCAAVMQPCVKLL